MNFSDHIQEVAIAFDLDRLSEAVDDYDDGSDGFGEPSYGMFVG